LSGFSRVLSGFAGCVPFFRMTRRKETAFLFHRPDLFSAVFPAAKGRKTGKKHAPLPRDIPILRPAGHAHPSPRRACRHDADSTKR